MQGSDILGFKTALRPVERRQKHHLQEVRPRCVSVGDQIVEMDQGLAYEALAVSVAPQGLTHLVLISCSSYLMVGGSVQEMQ